MAKEKVFDKFKKKLVVVEGGKLKRWWHTRKLSKECVKTNMVEGANIAMFLAAAAECFHKHHPSGCYGLAANQFGWNKQVFVIRKPNRNIFHTFINPVILKGSRMQKKKEFCLSHPGKPMMVNRFKTITVTADNLEGKKLELSGIQAQAFQHEIDHLNGELV